MDVSGDGEECEIPRRLEEVLKVGELLLSNLLVEYSIADPVGEIPTNTVAFTQVAQKIVFYYDYQYIKKQGQPVDRSKVVHK